MGQDDDEDKMAAAEEDEEEDLEKLQAEIDRMEAEAAKIAKQTEELEKKKLEKTGDAAAAISEEEQAAKDRYVRVCDAVVCLTGHCTVRADLELCACLSTPWSSTFALTPLSFVVAVFTLDKSIMQPRRRTW